MGGATTSADPATLPGDNSVGGGGNSATSAGGVGAGTRFGGLMPASKLPLFHWPGAVPVLHAIPSAARAP